MKIWKRCLSALLALIMLFTSANVGFAAGRLDGETNIWSATAADIVAEHYGLTSNAKIAAVLSNGAIRSGAEYAVAAPHVNGTEGKQDLIAVDYRNKAFYVKSYETEGYLWIPTAAVLLAEGEEKETFNLTESVCYYNNVEYYATEAFTYDGKHYTIEVTYELAVSIDAAEQQRIMEIPAYLAQTAKNIEKTLSGMWYDLYTFNGMVPALYSLLSLSLPADEAAGKEAEPFFDKTAHAAEIAAIEALYAECMKAETPPQLEMFLVCDESLKTSDSGLVYAMEEGEKVKNTAAALYEKLEVLAKSQRLNSLTSRFKAYDAAQGTSLSIELKNLYRYLDRFVGTAGKDGSLELLKDEANWAILDPAVQESIFKEDYDPQDFAALESAVSGLRNVNYTVPEAQDEVITAVQVTIPCEIITHDVTVSLSAQVVADDGVNTKEKKKLDFPAETIRVLDGTELDELEDIVDELGIETTAREKWNAISDAYQIGSGYYDIRPTLSSDGPLHADAEYTIEYFPKEYTVTKKGDNGFSGTEQLPFGYRLSLPEYSGKDGWYDYDVVYTNVSGSSDPKRNQGEIVFVDAAMTITQTPGAAKDEHRILTFLAADPQYAVNGSDEPQRVLSPEAANILINDALYSPTIKIRTPDTNITTPLKPVDGVFSIEVKDVPSGILGMTWMLKGVTLYNEDNVVQEVSVSNGKASWETTDFTRVEAYYEMQITNLSFTKKLTSAEITEYINLPHILSNQMSQQRDALNGNEDVTAKKMLEQLSDSRMSLVMTLLTNAEEWMETKSGKDAVRILNTPENEIAKDDEGKTIGYGARSAEDKLALIAYLEQCEDAGWSVAAYYRMGYGAKLKEHCLRLAKCIEDITSDPGFVKKLADFDSNGSMGLLEKLNDVDEAVSDLEELSEKMEDLDETVVDVNHVKFPDLVTACLAARGKTAPCNEAATLYAYTSVRRSSETSGSLQIKVQVEPRAGERLSIDYKLDDAASHEMTAEEADRLWNFINEVKASANLDERTEQFYKPRVQFGTVTDDNLDILPKEGDSLSGGDTAVVVTYTPKTYIVTIKGVSTELYEARITYHGGDQPYVIDLPAKSEDPNAKSYYQYIFPNRSGEDAVRNVANGTDPGQAKFSEEDLLTLFNGGSYSIIRKEIRILGDPELTFKPTLSAELIRGAKSEAIKKENPETKETETTYYLFLDAVYSGLSYAAFLENVNRVVENGGESSIGVYNADGTELLSEDYVGTGDVVRYKLKDVFGKDYESKEDEPSEYTIVMMGDVNGDGLCNDEDIEKIVDAYFIKEDKKILYYDQLVEELSWTYEQILAANMNNNKKIDSNDAWTIRSKSLYWDADKKQNQIVYRTVL